MKRMLFVLSLVVSFLMMSCDGIKESTRSRIHQDADSFHQKSQREWTQMPNTRH